jgi:hypothetical protein
MQGTVRAIADGYFGVFVGRGLGGPPRPGRVRVGSGVTFGPVVGAVVVGALVDTVVPAGVAGGVVAGTTCTTGTSVAAGVGVGAPPTGVDERPVGVLVEGLDVGTPPGPPPTAHAMPAEPITAAAPSTTTGP